MARTWTESEIVNLINSNAIFVERAVVKMLERQTADERAAKVTSKENGIGFNGPDAAYLTWAAEFVLGGAARNVPEGKRLMVRASEKGSSDRHLAKVRAKLVKYRRQLVEISNAA